VGEIGEAKKWGRKGEKGMWGQKKCNQKKEEKVRRR
jgi:hypothetical protein